MVFGVPLLPLCLGHALLLHRLGSPLITAAATPALADLLLAVEICRRPPPALPSRLRLRWLAAGQVRLTALGRARAEGRFLEGVAEFREYWADAHSRVPDYWPDPDVRDSGVPMLAALVDGLLGLGLDDAAALRCPVSRAVYLLAAHAARAGHLKLRTAEEAALIARARAQRLVVIEEKPDAPPAPADLLAAQAALTGRPPAPAHG